LEMGLKSGKVVGKMGDSKIKFSYLQFIHIPYHKLSTGYPQILRGK